MSLLRMDPNEQVVPLLRSRFNENEPDLSPDARWIAYTSDQTGRTKVRVSTEGGREPLWSNSGRELFYRVGDAVMAVQMTLSPTLAASAPLRLFEFPISTRDGSRSYDILPGDQQFVVLRRPASAGSMRTLNILRRSARE